MKPSDIKTPADLARYNAKQSAKAMNFHIPDQIFDKPKKKPGNPIIDFFRGK